MEPRHERLAEEKTKKKPGSIKQNEVQHTPMGSQTSLNYFLQSGLHQCLFSLQKP